MHNVMESEGVTLVVQRSTWRQIALESRPLKDHHQSRRLRRLREIKSQEEPRSEDQGGEAETMKGLIEEANKMLRSLTSSSAAGSSASSTSEKEEDSRSEVLSRLQAQLNSLKTFKLGRITKGMSKA